MAARHKSIETKYYEERDRVLRALRNCDRRTFLKLSAATIGAVMAKGLMPPHSFQLVEVANAAVEKGWSSVGAKGALPCPVSASVAHLKVKGTAMVASLAASSSTSAPSTRNFRSRRSDGQM